MEADTDNKSCHCSNRHDASVDNNYAYGDMAVRDWAHVDFISQFIESKVQKFYPVKDRQSSWLSRRENRSML